MKPVPIQRKCSSTLLSLLVAILIVISILDSAGAATHNFVVHSVEISPKVARNGENVRVKADLRNLENKTKKCYITASVGESVIEELKEITLSPRDTITLLFTVNTSALPQGNNAIDLVVEQPTSEPEIFDLGNIVVAQEKLEQESYAGFNLLYLVPILPVGAVVSFFVWKKVRKKRKEQKLPDNLLPNLLNEVLNFEENVEKGAEQKKLPSDDKSYIR